MAGRESEIEQARKRARNDGVEAISAWIVVAASFIPNFLDGEVIEVAEAFGALALTARWLFAEIHYKSLQRRSSAVLSPTASPRRR